MAKRKAPAKPASDLRLLILDDHALFCAGLEQLFRGRRAVREVVWATTLAAGTRLARRIAPHVVLLRPRLDGNGPNRVAEAFRFRGSKARLLFLDNAIRQVHVRQAIELGASGYWTKHATFAELAEAVSVVAAGGTAFCPDVAKCVAVTPGGLTYRPPKTSSLLHQLSPRETEVLVFLAQGMSVKQCADRLELSPSTIDNHKVRLMHKLGLHKTVELAVLAMREGLVE